MIQFHRPVPDKSPDFEGGSNVEPFASVLNMARLNNLRADSERFLNDALM